MNLLKNKITLLFVLGFTAFTNAALPTDISELVEASAPAVVNITSRKEVKMQNSLRGFDEFERFFGIPRGRGFPQPQQPETREAVAEIQRVSKGKSYIIVDAYNNDEEKKRMEQWQVAGHMVLSESQWIDIFESVSYTGDYFWFKP